MTNDVDDLGRVHPIAAALHEVLRLAIELRGPVPCQLSPVPQAWDYDSASSRLLADVAASGCDRCPVRGECLLYALARPEADGVWGGLTPPERQALRAEMEAS